MIGKNSTPGISNPFARRLASLMFLLVCATGGCAISPNADAAHLPDMCQVDIVNETNLNLDVSYTVVRKRTSAGYLSPQGRTSVGVECGKSVSVYARSDVARPGRGLITVRASTTAEAGKIAQAVLRENAG